LILRPGLPPSGEAAITVRSNKQQGLPGYSPASAPVIGWNDRPLTPAQSPGEFGWIPKVQRDIVRFVVSIAKLQSDGARPATPDLRARHPIRWHVVFEAVDFREEHQVERKSRTDDQAVSRNGHDEASTGAAQSREP
jgi:hypothetical protein